MPQFKTTVQVQKIKPDADYASDGKQIVLLVWLRPNQESYRTTDFSLHAGSGLTIATGISALAPDGYRWEVVAYERGLIVTDASPDLHEVVLYNAFVATAMIRHGDPLALARLVRNIPFALEER